MVLWKKAKQLRMTLSVPEALQDKVKVSKAYQSCDKAGKVIGYGVDLTFPEMHLTKSIRSADFALLHGKIENALRGWEKRYIRHLDKLNREQRSASVEELTQEAQQATDELGQILLSSLTVNDAVDWEAIKRQDTFTILPEELIEHKPPAYIRFANNGKPALFIRLYEPKEPLLKNIKKEFNPFQRMFKGKIIRAEHMRRYQEWEKKLEDAHRDNQEREAVYQTYLQAWKEKKRQFEEEKSESNTQLDDIRVRYEIKEAKAIEEYCDLVLNQSVYPDYFPHSWHLEYRPDKSELVVDYDMPVPQQLPSVAAYAYVKSEDQVIVRHHPTEYMHKLYNSVVLQICLRTIHELFEADVNGTVEEVVFNGMVRILKKNTDIKEIRVILSVRATKERFQEFDLSIIDPRATFKLLKGSAEEHLYEMIPVRPVVPLARGDRREISEEQLDQEIT